MTGDRYTCQCCGHRTLDEPPGRYAMCPVCHWEDDGWHANDEQVVKGPNAMTLTEGQRRYQLYGSSALHLCDKARAPRHDERLDPAWKPQPSRRNEVTHLLSDYGELLSAATAAAWRSASDDAGDRAEGRLEGLRDAMRLLIEQAERFGLPRELVGVDPQLELDDDLTTGPSNRFAG